MWIIWLLIGITIGVIFDESIRKLVIKGKDRARKKLDELGN